MWKPSSETYWRKSSTKPTRFKLKQVHKQFYSPLFFILFFQLEVFWLVGLLTWAHTLPRCAADTSRCTAADERSPPGKWPNTRSPFMFSSKVSNYEKFVLTRVSFHTQTRFLLTDLAHFLEVEFRQSVEPVGQLSEVEKLDLEPESQTDRKRWREWRFFID